MRCSRSRRCGGGVCAEGPQGTLFLEQVVDDLSAVFAEVGKDVADMHPVGAAAVVLPYQLVKG